MICLVKVCRTKKMKKKYKRFADDNYKTSILGAFAALRENIPISIKDTKHKLDS